MIKLGDREEGAFAVLYAVLVVVLVGMGAVVVDLATVRQDRRLNRSAADAAVLGGADLLNPSGGSPQAACLKAWDYLRLSLDLDSSEVFGSPCGSFAGQTLSYCDTSPHPEIRDTVAIAGGRTVIVAWPVPQGSEFLIPEIAPGSATQDFNATADGTTEGCDRIGVAIIEDEQFALGGVLGVSGTQTQVHSVARFTTDPGDEPEVAALNVLNPTACKALDTGGQGDVLVNRSIDSRDPTKFGRGVIAVESNGGACGNNASDYVMAVSNNTQNRVCASGPTQVPDLLGTCDGKGLILVHAKDPGGQRAYPGTPGAPTVPITPTPVPEGQISRWKPVTDIYGCHDLPDLTTPEVDCGSLTPNYMDELHDAYAGTGAPTTTYAGTGTYTGNVYGAFQTLPSATYPWFTCDPDNLYVPPGNWFVNCPDAANKTGFALKGNGSVVVFGGGHVVFAGGIDAAKSGACFAFNVPMGVTPLTSGVTCPTTINAQSSIATTNPTPVQEAILFSRGTRSISNGSSDVTVLMPQTLVVQSGGGSLDLGGGSGTVLWTAPGAGALTGGVSALNALCSGASVCLNSHFEKLSYWNESTAPDNIGGQGSITYVGVYFAPRAQFTFKGQGGGAGTNAQFWADTLRLDGQAKLHLTPDLALSVPRPVYRVSLIR